MPRERLAEGLPKVIEFEIRDKAGVLESSFISEDVIMAIVHPHKKKL